MNSKAILALAVLLGATRPVWAAPPPVTGGHLTQAQAVADARAFCRAIGSPATGPARAAFSRTGRFATDAPTYWQPCWRVLFGDEAEVSVADSGVVCDYFKPDPSSPDVGDQGRQPPGPAISRAAALAKAAAVLAAARVTEPLGPPQARESNMLDPPQRDGHEWSITQQRQAQGVAFQDQQVTVIMQADTGAVVGLGVTFPTPPPAPVRPVLTAAQADRAAQAALAHFPHVSPDLRRFGPAQLIWVTPQMNSVTPPVNGVVNSPPQPTRERYLPARLAWMCSFRGPRGASAFLPVDAITGKVVPDGLAFGYGPLPPFRPPSVPPPPDPAPPPAVVDHPVVATTLPGATVPPPPPNVRRYRLSLTDVYAPFAALTALGFDPVLSDLGGNEETDQKIAEKLEQAARDGKLILVPGPSAVVPEGGVWGLTRTREALCKAPIYWQPRPVPARIGMTFSIKPEKQADGRIEYTYEVGSKALATGEAWAGGRMIDGGSSAWSWGDAGATTLLGGLDEEHYSWETGTGGPSNIKSDGILHIILVHSILLP